MSLMQAKYQYYQKGPDFQKRSDITIDLRRPDIKKIAKWTAQERAGLHDFIRRARASFNAFADELAKYETGPETQIETER